MRLDGGRIRAADESVAISGPAGTAGMKRRIHLTVNEGLRMMAGLFVVASVALGYFVNPWYFAFTAFVGLNLFQSAFTRWCPMMWMLEKAGLRR